MKTKVLAFSLLGFSAFAYGGSSAVKLPQGVRASLNKNYSGWRIADVSKGVQDYETNTVHSALAPNFLSGDFDGDGKTDYAVLVIYPRRKEDEESPDSKELENVLVFISRGKEFEINELRAGPPDPDKFITLEKKGTKIQDVVSQQGFQLTTDAVTLNWFEKAAETYFWKDGNFETLSTGD